MRPTLVSFYFSLLAAGSCFAQDCSNPALGPANNKFGIDIYNALLRQKETAFFSPYSIFSALLMTADGAKEATAAEMLQTLYSKDNLDCIHADIKKSQQRYNSFLETGDSIHVANSLWIQNSFPLTASFVSQAKETYAASVSEVDFFKKFEVSRKTINEWVEEQTNKRIKELLAPGKITPDTKLVLVNTIWLKAKWLFPFDANKTKDDIFHAAADKDLKIPFMHTTRVINYLEDETLQAIELPYQSEKISMLVFLPVKWFDTEFYKITDAAHLIKWIGDMKMQRVNVSLPKFKMNSSFNLNDMLKESGMKTAFTDAADFTGISTVKGLKISDVIHKAFIEVGEEGTEAAAATAVTVMTRSIAQQPPPAKTFKADRPFVFVLYDKEAKTILFMGKMEKPE